LTLDAGAYDRQYQAMTPPFAGEVGDTVRQRSATAVRRADRRPDAVVGGRDPDGRSAGIAGDTTAGASTNAVIGAAPEKVDGTPPAATDAVVVRTPIARIAAKSRPTPADTGATTSGASRWR